MLSGPKKDSFCALVQKCCSRAWAERRRSTLLHGLGQLASGAGRRRKTAAHFYDSILRRNWQTDVAVSCRKRLERYRDRLLTFLDYDDVPWNNNNAEHAVRAFTRLRNVMATSTANGTREYATLLSIQQTLKYRGKSFLDFLRSGRIDLA